MKLILIRHGMTPGNEKKHYLGVTDEHLSEAGRTALEENKKKGLYPKPDAVFVSPMVRCVETKEIIYPEYEAEKVNEFREIDFGKFEGKNHQELEIDPEYQKWLDSGGMGQVPGGESMADMMERCRIGMEYALKKCEADENIETVAFVVHGGTVMAVLAALTESGFYNHMVKNGEGYICSLYKKEGKWTAGDVRKIQ